MDAGEGREQAVPAHPALTAFVRPCTADAEASRFNQNSLTSFSMEEGAYINGLRSISC